MGFLVRGFVIHRLYQIARPCTIKTKKADVAEYHKVFDHVGLLYNEPASLSWNAPRLVIRQHEDQTYTSNSFSSNPTLPL
jgi:hypothetical protein